jgi:hypothetical protein
MTKVRFCLIARWLVLPGLVVSGSLLAMGTPPQKPAKSVSEASANAIMLKTDELRVAPDAGANVLARVEKGARVRLLATQGGWRQISSLGKTGWVRVLSLSADAQSGVAWSDLEALGKTSQGTVVAVAGTRGLDEETLKAAVYSESELQFLHAYAMSRGEAEQFALAAGLQARTLSYLDAPKQSDELGAVNATALLKGN